MEAPEDIVGRLASLIRLRDGTEFEGEKLAAENAIAKLLIRWPDLDEQIAKAAEQKRIEAMAAAEAELRARAAAARTQRWGGGHDRRHWHAEAEVHFASEFAAGTVKPPGSWHGNVEEFSPLKTGVQVSNGGYAHGAWNKKW